MLEIFPLGVGLFFARWFSVPSVDTYFRLLEPQVVLSTISSISGVGFFGVLIQIKIKSLGLHGKKFLTRGRMVA